MLKANFNITETGGTGVVLLQSSSDSGTTWTAVGSALTLSQGALTVDDAANVSIDTSVFIPGSSYQFRLTDAAGAPVSNIVSYTMPSISAYASGISSIDFTPTGGDNYEIVFHAVPASIQSVPPATVASYQSFVSFYQSLVQTEFVNDQDTNTARTTDSSYNPSGNGAGVYFMRCKYTLTSGLRFTINRLVKVDGSGNILADYQANGAHITSVNGLDITIEAEITQTGVNYPLTWAAMNEASGDVALLGTGNPVSFTLPTFTDLILKTADMDAVFTDDYDGDFFPNEQVVIV